MTATLDMTMNTCQRSNGITGSTRVSVYVAGGAGTPYRIAYEWEGITTANSTTGRIGASIDYSSFQNFGVSVDPGQSVSRTEHMQGLDVGTTSGTSIASGGITYTLARTYQLNGGIGTNGQCFTCSDNCCDCGLGQVTSTLSTTVLPPP